MVDSVPDAIADRLREFGQPFERIGLEAGPLSQWIYAGLVDVGLAAICVETRHMHATLSARINKTDRNDARGIAQKGTSARFIVNHRRGRSVRAIWNDTE